jgi:hypothetical protein
MSYVAPTVRNSYEDLLSHQEKHAAVSRWVLSVIDAQKEHENESIFYANPLYAPLNRTSQVNIECKWKSMKDSSTLQIVSGTVVPPLGAWCNDEMNVSAGRTASVRDYSPDLFFDQ